MSETLYIRLASQANQPLPWLVWSHHQKEIIASGELPNADALVNLQDKAKSRQVVALAPSSDVSLKALKVPGKSRKAIAQAAPYMLEEELAHEVENLFFAYGNLSQDSEGHNCFTAIATKDKMVMWQSWLTQAGLVCRTMVPEALMLPEHEGSWTAIALGDQLILRQGQWQGFTLDAAQWQVLANQWQQFDPVPSIHHYSPIPAVPATIETIAEPEELPLALMAEQPVILNMLQGEFAVKTERSPAMKYWLTAAGLLGFAILLQLGAKGAELYQINQAQAQLEAQIISAYKKALPETKRVRISTVRSQLKRKVAELGGGSESAGFLPMLAKLERAFKQVPSMQTQSIKFDGKRNEIRLQTEAKDYQSFDKFKSVLEQAKLDVTLGAQNNQGESVTGSFSIKEA